MENSEVKLSQTGLFNVQITNKSFDIDYSKIKTIEDVIVVLKSLNISIDWHQEECPEQFKEIYEKGFLIEKK